MKIIHSVKELSFWRAQLSKKASLGFVPTMGALHDGHLSLVDASCAQNDSTIVSIFVNPTQFNDPNDLAKYPKDHARDIALLKSRNVDAIFIPDVDQMYTSEELSQNFDAIELKSLDQKLEGLNRPGHFNGVVQIVSKLLNLVRPQIIFLGQKDYQQFLIIKQMIKSLGLPILASKVKTKREANGLAMSSRNEQLTKEEREHSKVIYQTLQFIKENKHNYALHDLRQKAINRLKKASVIKEVEYVELLNADNLENIESIAETANIIACVAVKTQKVRLIDNMFI